MTYVKSTPDLCRSVDSRSLAELIAISRQSMKTDLGAIVFNNVRLPVCLSFPFCTAISGVKSHEVDNYREKKLGLKFCFSGQNFGANWQNSFVHLSSPYFRILKGFQLKAIGPSMYT